MRKIMMLTTAVSVALSAPAHGEQSMCDQLAQLVETIARAHQDGVPLAQLNALPAMRQYKTTAAANLRDGGPVLNGRRAGAGNRRTTRPRPRNMHSADRRLIDRLNLGLTTQPETRGEHP